MRLGRQSDSLAVLMRDAWRLGAYDVWCVGHIALETSNQHSRRGFLILDGRGCRAAFRKLQRPGAREAVTDVEADWACGANRTRVWWW